MAYLHNRIHDIFISFAHKDDDPSGWVTQFALFLNKELKRQLEYKEREGEKIDPVVWQDHLLPQHGSLSHQLEKEIKTSSLFLVIMSESYLQSDWCKKEGRTFVNQFNNKKGSRIFIIERKKTNKEDWPDFCKDDEGRPLQSCAFYDELKINQKITIPMITPQGKQDPRVEPILERFCDGLSNEMYSLRHDSGSSPDPGVKKIFLAINAEAGYAQKTRALLKHNLAKFNDIVLYPVNDPEEKNDFQASLQNIHTCNLFVQILDDSKGLYLSKDSAGFVGHQFKEAKQNNKKILHWMVPNLDFDGMAQTAYKDFLQSLKPLEEEGGTIFQGTLDELAQIVHDYKESVKRPDDDRNTDPLIFTINSQGGEEELAKEVQEKLFSFGTPVPIKPVTILDKITPEELAFWKSREEGIVIVSGDKPDPEWINEKTNLFYKAVQKGKKMLGALAFFGDHTGYNFGGFHYIDLRKSIPEEKQGREIEKFVNEVLKFKHSQANTQRTEM